MHVSAPARGAEAPAAWTTATVPSPAVTPTPDVPTPAEPAVLLPASEPGAPKSKSNSSGRPDANARPQQKANTSSGVSTAPAPAAVPSGAPPVPAQTPVPTPAAELPPPPPPPDEIAAAPVKEPPKPRFDELTVTENSVIGIHLDSTVSSDTAKVEDKVTARVSRDVVVSGRTAIPAGSKLKGNVTLVERGGKFKDKARLGIRFTTLVLPDNTRQTIQTDALFREASRQRARRRQRSGRAPRWARSSARRSAARRARQSDPWQAPQAAWRGASRRSKRRRICGGHAAHAKAHQPITVSWRETRIVKLIVVRLLTTGTSGTTGPRNELTQSASFWKESWQALARSMDLFVPDVPLVPVVQR